ncbi:putative ribonuclease H-like domain-containing protein [Tanacetum coccineum]
MVIWMMAGLHADNVVPDVYEVANLMTLSLVITVTSLQNQRHMHPVNSASDQDQRPSPPAVDITGLGQCLDVDDPNSTDGQCDFYNCDESVPCNLEQLLLSALGSMISPAYVTAGGSDPAASRNRPAVNSAGRPNPAGWDDGGTAVKTSEGDPSTDNDIGIVDSGCSRSMTGNKEKLDDFVQVKGGIVKFGGGDGRISGKGTIRTSKLDFENVYYVEELQLFNFVFSVSQICDKKNKVLFTDTDCLVLTEDFQLPDESQVVLRIPRKCDLYTFSISELQPEQNVTCLVAKASLDESTRWHRRMAHVNFKTINKLAKEGLVDGLPLKVFTNEHNCVACNKGKQHKASYKHISAVRLITEPLQLLHMDLFGPTNIRSFDKK